MLTRRRIGYIHKIHPMFNTMRVSFPYFDQDDDPGIVIPIPTSFPANLLAENISFSAEWPYADMDYDKRRQHDFDQMTTNPDYLTDFEIL